MTASTEVTPSVCAEGRDAAGQCRTVDRGADQEGIGGTVWFVAVSAGEYVSKRATSCRVGGINHNVAVRIAFAMFFVFPIDGAQVAAQGGAPDGVGTVVAIGTELVIVGHFSCLSGAIRA